MVVLVKLTSHRTLFISTVVSSSKPTPDMVTSWPPHIEPSVGDIVSGTSCATMSTPPPNPTIINETAVIKYIYMCSNNNILIFDHMHVQYVACSCTADNPQNQ